MLADDKARSAWRKLDSNRFNEIREKTIKKKFFHESDNGMTQSESLIIESDLIEAIVTL